MSRRVLRVALWGMFVDQCSHQPYARYFIRRKRPTISRLLGIYATFSEGSKGSKHFNSAALTFRPSGLWVLSRILSSDRPSFAFPPPAPAAEDAHAPTCAFYNNSCTCARTPTPTPSQHELLQIMLRKKRRAGKKAEKMRKTTR